MSFINENNVDISFFKDYLKEEKNLKESTIFQYLSVLKRFLVNNPDVENIRYYNDFLIKHSIKSRNTHYYSVLKSYIRWKISDGNLKNRLIERLIVPQEHKDFKRERRYLTEKEMIIILNYLDNEKHRIIALIQMITGVRAGDILRLKKGNIKPEIYEDEAILKLIIKGKGDKRNIVPIYNKCPQELIVDYITKNQGVEDYYFLEYGSMKNREGGGSEFKLYQMNYRWYWHDLKQALQTANIDKDDFATHDFRRCFARRLWEKDKDVEKLRRALNHANISTSMGYLDQSGLTSIDIHKEMQQK